MDARLYAAAQALLGRDVSPTLPLTEQGLDSLIAEELIESLKGHGVYLDYSLLIAGGSLSSLSLQLKQADDGPSKLPSELVRFPVRLTGSQSLWCDLEDHGWGAWANISLCISVPAALVPPAFLAAMAQALCDANDALRMVLVRPHSQRPLQGYQLPVQITTAPQSPAHALRLVEDFEAENRSPYATAARALILAAPADGVQKKAEGAGPRNWLCLTAHHAFCDREALNVRCMP